MSLIRIVLPASLLLFFSLTGYNQVEKNSLELFQQSDSPLSERDLDIMLKVPLLPVTSNSLKTTLPSAIDNSTQPYFYGIWKQVDYCCAQVAGILYTFSYEINRLRGIATNSPDQSYATHFLWNFQNGPSCDRATCYVNSWELMRKVGAMSVADWGGTPDFGEGQRWISGYDLYRNAMENKVESYYKIDVRDEAGLIILKNWLVHHNENSAVGGLACIYVGNYIYDFLSSSSPYSGEYIITQWGINPIHSMTIVGYDDSIRYDYNHDGQFTNDIDIDGDGYVNMSDWEIGAFKLANSLGTTWANDGYVWAMYKTIADEQTWGGIWNHAAYVVTAKANYSPLMTYKIRLEHTSRIDLSIAVGVANDTNATEPEFYFEPGIIDYQGGDHFMQGNSADSAKTIEFGIDISELLNYTTPGQPARFFFQVVETDFVIPDSGQVVFFSLIDESAGNLEIVKSGLPAPIVNNGITNISLVYNPTVNKPLVTTATLPTARLYEPYAFQMEATNGTPPYSWAVKRTFTEIDADEPFTLSGGDLLQVTNPKFGKSVVHLDFGFPYYGQVYDSLYAYVDGFLTFDNQVLPWPYFFEEDKLPFLKGLKCIGPFITNQELAKSNDGIWVEQNADSAIIRWRTTIFCYYQWDSTQVDFATILYPDGRIKFCYGSCDNNTFQFASGVSLGDGNNYNASAFSDFRELLINKSVIFSPELVNGFTDLTLSPDGLISGIPTDSYDNVPMLFEVTDNKGLRSSQMLNFNATGVLSNYDILYGDDSIAGPGEIAELSLQIKNCGAFTLAPVHISLTSDFPDIHILNGNTLLPLLLPGQTLNLNSLFEFKMDESVQEGSHYEIKLTISSGMFNQTMTIPITTHRPNFSLYSVYVEDGDNQYIESGDSAILTVIIMNSSPAKMDNIQWTLLPVSTCLIVTDIIELPAVINGNETDTLRFHLFSPLSCPEEESALYQLSATNNQGIQHDISFVLPVNCHTETFESGDLCNYSWSNSVAYPWTFCPSGFISQTSLRSATNLLPDSVSSLYIEMTVLESGNISFFHKTSSEDFSDFLRFYVDGLEWARWSGETDWKYYSAQISPGHHTFVWKYTKDGQGAFGEDCAWLDLISFPPVGNQVSPQLAVLPANILHWLEPNENISDSIVLRNTGGGTLNYLINFNNNHSLSGTITSKQMPSWVHLSSSSGSIPAGGSQVITATYDLSHFSDSLCGTLNISGNPDQTRSLPISLYLTHFSISDLFLVREFGHLESLNDSLIITNNLSTPTDITAVVEPSVPYLPHHWLSIDNNQFTIPAYHEYVLPLYFSGNNAPEGNYQCNLILTDQYSFSRNIVVEADIIAEPYVEENFKEPFSIYPNPACKWITVELKHSQAKPSSLYIRDICGRRLLNTNLTEKKTIVDLNDLAEGLYFICIDIEGVTFSVCFNKISE